MKNFFYGLLIIAGVCALTWVGVANNWAITKVFAPKMEQVRRETFEQSKAYNQGTIQEIQQMQFQYIQGTPVQKAAMATVILESTADYDIRKLPPNLQQFVESLRAANDSTSTTPQSNTIPVGPVKEYK